MRVANLLREFVQDFAGATAAQKPTSLAKDTPGSALIAVVAVASSLKSARDFVVDALGIGGAFLPALVAMSGLLASAYAIWSKNQPEKLLGFATVPVPTKQYSFGLWTRRFAKIGLIAFCVILPCNIAEGIEETSLLPVTITGIIIDAATQTAVEGARIRIVAKDGVDVTGQVAGAETDSQGVFVVTATQRVRRNATLAVYRPGWKPTRAPLWKRFQTPVPPTLMYVDPSTSPFFTLPMEFQK